MRAGDRRERRRAGAFEQLRHRAVAARYALEELHARGHLAVRAGVVGGQRQRAAVADRLAHDLAVRRQHDLRGLVLGGEGAARLQRIDEVRARQRRAGRKQHAGTVTRAQAPVGAMIVLVAGRCDLVTALEHQVEGAGVGAVAGFGFGGVGRESRGIEHFRQHHHLGAVGIKGDAGAADGELAAGRMVELADPAARLHRRVQVGIVRLDRGDAADELVAAVVFPARQGIGIDDVEVAAVADHAPLVAVQGKEVGMRAAVVGRGGHA